MTYEVFVGIFILIIAILFYLSFRFLPGEQWQFAAIIRIRQTPAGGWQGLNLTYYGVLIATASLVAAFVLILLMLSIGLAFWQAIIVALFLPLLGLPVSAYLARWIDGKPHTYTIGGAFFASFFVMPPVLHLLNYLWPGFDGPVLPIMATLAIAYCFGEGVGRLACISFGCCYGKPISSLKPWMRRMFGPWAFTFSGATKKISYASDLHGVPVVPVQAITACICVTTGIVSMLMFYGNAYAASFTVAILVTQGWRVISETLRADNRGGWRMTPYQWMALASTGYVLVLFLILPGSQVVTDFDAGLRKVWDPYVLVFLQGVWLSMFLATGLSKVTGATLSFHVRKDRI